MSDQALKLEQYILLAKSARGESAAKLIVNATSAPGVYVFAELLEQPSIQDLANTSHADHLALLQLFAYGTLADHKANPNGVPSLTTAQITKLKHLTLLSLAQRNRSIPYDAISGAVEVESVRELEDLIIDVMYAGLLGGKLHHDEKVLHVDWVSGRDVNPESLDDLVNGLQQWCQTSRTLLTALDDQIAYLRNQNAQDASDRTAYNSARNVAFLNASKPDSQSGPNRQGSFQSLPTYDQVQAVGSKDSGRFAGRGGIGSRGSGGDDARVSKRLKSDEMEE